MPGGNIVSAAFDRVGVQVAHLQTKIEAALAACRANHGAVRALDDEPHVSYSTGRRVYVPGSGN